MKLTLTIPDDQYDALVDVCGGNKLQLHQHAVKTLTTFGMIKPGERTIVLQGDERRAVEAVFRTTVADGADLIKKLKHLALFTIGPVERVLDANELAVLREQASFHGSDPDAYLRFVANEVIDRCLDRV